MKRLIVALVLLSSNASAQAVAVADGATLRANGKLYRLWGIDAPDPRQTCDDGWGAGQEAIKALSSLIAGHRIECQERGRDRAGRILAVCKADGVDIGAAMVRLGMAWADVRESHDYEPLEHDALYEKKGAHDHDCLLPWKWRENPR